MSNLIVLSWTCPVCAEPGCRIPTCQVPTLALLREGITGHIRAAHPVVKNMADVQKTIDLMVDELFRQPPRALTARDRALLKELAISW